MSPATGLVYEVTLSVDREIVSEFDAWLEGHTREMLELPGFAGSDTFEIEDDAAGRAGRVVRYFLEDEHALHEYLSGPAEEMRREAVSRFGDLFSAARRVLRQHGRPDIEDCLNCGTPLQGQYCANCGQRAKGRLISIWELIRDAVEDVFEVDSRLWRTIIPLVFRPGLLTHEYLIGRRARFMPPFRTYLVLSIVFFLVAFFDPQQQFGILFEPADETVESDSAAGTVAGIRDEVRREVLDELAADGITVPGSGQYPDDPAATAADTADGQESTAAPAKPSRDMDVNCDFDFTMDAPAWLARRLTEDRVRHVCERIVADMGRSFFNQLLDNVPAALFLLLPLMALILKMLYPLSRRYYVEHLLFLLHFHAFFFLILTAQVLFSRLVTLLSLPGLLANLSAFVVSVYVPIYLYKSMRRVYAQGRIITLLKYFVLFMSYAVGLTVMFLFTAFYTAFSI